MTSTFTRARAGAALAGLSAIPIVAMAGPVADPVPAPAALDGPVRIEREAWAMGTRIRLEVVAGDRGDAVAASEAVLREIGRVERVLSTWDETSELGRLNAAPVGRPLVLSDELSGWLGEAFAWAERTGRAFDPTVGALVDAWDVRGEGRVPSDAELAAARAAVGPTAVSLDDNRARRAAGSAWLDSGGFGKGAALRSVSALPAPPSVERLLVDLGGQIWAEAPPEAPWPVDVAHPRDRARPVARLAVHGVSVATSGASERPGHLLDPRSGRPARDWGSVTVVSGDALAADALSTALYVMGPEAGLEWARAHGVAALFLEATPAGLRARWSEAMDAWLVDVPVDVSGDATGQASWKQVRRASETTSVNP